MASHSLQTDLVQQVYMLHYDDSMRH